MPPGRHLDSDHARRHHRRLRRQAVNGRRPAAVVGSLEEDDSRPLRLHRAAEDTVLERRGLRDDRPGRSGGRRRTGERRRSRCRPGERDAGVDPSRREVRLPEVPRRQLEVGAIRRHARRTVDDLEVPRRRHLPQAMPAAAREQLRRDAWLAIGGQDQVADVEHLVLRRVRLVEGRLDIGRELRGLIALSHPDKWPANPLAHEITSRLTELRSRCAA